MHRAPISSMHEILPRIYIWGSTYEDRPWDLNGYAVALDEGTVLIDPPAPLESDWPKFDALKPITRIVLTNRDHVRDAELFRSRYRGRLVACADEISQFAPVVIDETVREGDLIASAFRVIQLPGKSPGEIALLFGQILFLGDAIIGNPPGSLGLIPEHKLDDPQLLRQSLRKLLDYDFDAVLLCDGKPLLGGGKEAVERFVSAMSIEA
jgi:glyoxylase-like metal-dependent hydrolase (beta-lactamase superfamily II)